MPEQAEAARSRLRLILILCCFAQFMIILDVSVVNVALPAIRSDLGFSAVDLQWIVNAYALTFAGFLLLGGRAADLIGQRRVFVFGLAVFTLASLGGGLATTQEQLVLARGVQGLGGAIVAPVTLAVLTTSFAEGAERNRALGLWGAMGAVGGSTGVLLGGLLTDLLGWRWVLFINVPVGIALALLAARVVTDLKRLDAQRHYDLAGALTVTSGLILITLGIVRTDVNGWGSAETLLLLGGGLVLLAAFVLIEGRVSKRPLVPLRIFQSRSLTAANVVVFFLGSSAFAMWYFVSLYMQQVLGYSPIHAGIAFLPMPVAIAVASTRAGKLTARYGPGRVLGVGMALIGLGMLLFAQAPPDGVWLRDVLAPAVITATGIGLAFVPVTIAAVSGVERSEAGLASGLVNTSRQVGGALGLAILATVAGSRTAHAAAGGHVDAAALTTGFHGAFVVGALFALAGSAAAFLGLARQPVPQAA